MDQDDEVQVLGERLQPIDVEGEGEDADEEEGAPRAPTRASSATTLPSGSPPPPSAAALAPTSPAAAESDRDAESDAQSDPASTTAALRSGSKRKRLETPRIATPQDDIRTLLAPRTRRSNRD